MESIRQKRNLRLAELTEEKQRLTDWREYVRSAPLATVAGALVLGALASSRLVDASRHQVPETPAQFRRSGSPSATRPSLMGRVAGTVGSMALAIAMNTVKRQLASSVLSFTRSLSQGSPDHEHENEPVSSTWK